MSSSPVHLTRSGVTLVEVSPIPSRVAAINFHAAPVRLSDHASRSGSYPSLECARAELHRKPPTVSFEGEA